MKRVVLLSFMVATFAACKKSELPIIQNEKRSEQQSAKIEFAQTFAKAIAKEPLLRSFIKSEALKQFDKDYDVLLSLVKDQKLEDGESVYEKIVKYTSTKESLDKDLRMLPLLTIYVPILPEFSAENWETNSQIPMIAVEPDKKNLGQKSIEIYDAEGNKIDLEFKYVPGFPVIVIKNNERVTIQNIESDELRRKQFMKGSDVAVPFINKDGLTYSFISNDFNGNIQSRVTPASGIDAVNIEAFNSGNEWQRDYVYYGITPTNQIGIFTNRFSEFIKSFKFINGNDYYLVSDQQNDPKLESPFFAPYHPNSPVPIPRWIKGNYEFRISVLINAKNGVGQELRKIFTAQGQELFEPVYQRKKLSLYWVYTVVGVTPKEFYPTNLELIPWDLEQYGSAWKFIIAEYDPAEEITRTVTNSSTFGSNFSFDPTFSGTVKGGAKFGLTATTNHSTVYVYKTTTGSEDLGEGILDFRSPIITNYSSGNYTTYEVTTGVVSFSVEPQRIY